MRTWAAAAREREDMEEQALSALRLMKESKDAGILLKVAAEAEGYSVDQIIAASGNPQSQAHFWECIETLYAAAKAIKPNLTDQLFKELAAMGSEGIAEVQDFAASLRDAAAYASALSNAAAYPDESAEWVVPMLHRSKAPTEVPRVVESGTRSRLSSPGLCDEFDVLEEVCNCCRDSGEAHANSFFASAARQPGGRTFLQDNHFAYDEAAREIMQAAEAAEQVAGGAQKDADLLKEYDGLGADEILDLYNDGEINEQQRDALMRGIASPRKLARTADKFDEFRDLWGADAVDGFLAAFGIGPKYRPQPAATRECPSCGKKNAVIREEGSDCDGGQDEMVLECPDCGFEKAASTRTAAWSMTPDQHNSLRFWTLRQCDQDPKKAERMAREISGRIRRLPAEYVAKVRDMLPIDGWSGVVAFLDRYDSNDALVAQASSAGVARTAEFWPGRSGQRAMVDEAEFRRHVEDCRKNDNGLYSMMGLPHLEPHHFQEVATIEQVQPGGEALLRFDDGTTIWLGHECLLPAPRHSRRTAAGSGHSGWRATVSLDKPSGQYKIRLWDGPTFRQEIGVLYLSYWQAKDAAKKYLAELRLNRPAERADLVMKLESAWQVFAFRAQKDPEFDPHGAYRSVNAAITMLMNPEKKPDGAGSDAEIADFAIKELSSLKTPETEKAADQLEEAIKALAAGSQVQGPAISATASAKGAVWSETYDNPRDHRNSLGKGIQACRRAAYENKATAWLLSRELGGDKRERAVFLGDEMPAGATMKWDGKPRQWRVVFWEHGVPFSARKKQDETA